MSAQPGNQPPVIRAMLPSDLDAIADIERRAYRFPWGRNIFSDCLMAGYLSVVIDDGGRVIGYAIVSVAAAEAHILNLCVDADLHGQGYGRLLLEHILQAAREQRVQRMFLEVRPSNTAAVALYEKAGFEHLGIRKAYYKADDGREDALVLVYEFSNPV